MSTYPELTIALLPKTPLRNRNTSIISSELDAQVAALKMVNGI